MYCYDDCKYLDEQKHVCKATGKKLTYAKRSGLMSYTVHEHDGVCRTYTKNIKVFVYGMRLRGFSPGCQPMDGLARRLDDPQGKYHDLLWYERPLTDKEVKFYELDFVEERMP